MSGGAAGATRRLRILLHAQHLSGVGHFVRMREIGRALAARHDVTLLDGGREVPDAHGIGAALLPLPRIERGEAGLVPLDRSLALAEAMSRRAAMLTTVAAELRPDVLVIEHFPFSKWDLRGEIEQLVAAVRRARPGARVICSVRDIPRQTSHENCPPETWQRTVLSSLYALFDAVMVHGDERLTPLSASFPAAGSIRIPVGHTGIVAEPTPDAAAAGRDAAELTGGARYVIASIGGGSDPADLLGHCERGWRRLQEDRGDGDRVLVLCAGLRDGARQRAGPANPGIRATGFDHRFLGWLSAADLSVSYAGYNTCANLLATGTPGLLVANPRMSDQPRRAEVMESLGAARSWPAGSLDSDKLATVMRAALGQSRPASVVRLDGAARAARFIEELAGLAPA